MQKQATNRCLLYTGGPKCHDKEHSSERQERRLQDFAARHHLQVVGSVSDNTVSATTRWCNTAALTERKRQRDDFDLLLMTDLSRLSRDGICHLITALKKLADAGITVMTLDNGIIDTSLLSSVTLGLTAGTDNGLESQTVKQEKPYAPSKENLHERLGDHADPAGGSGLPPRA